MQKNNLDMPNARNVTQKEMCHERLGAEFEKALSLFDTNRRVKVLIDDFLSDEMVHGKEALDVGCGFGYFSNRLKQRGANVLACDIGPGLVEKTRMRVGCKAVVGDALNLISQFGANRFDLVVSSECIEHVPNPTEALRQMAGVLKPGGVLSISTPNKIWYPAVRIATLLRARPFDGHEKFSTFRSIENALLPTGVEIIRRQGLHLFPFQLRLEKLSSWCDDHLQVTRSIMINLCVLGRKIK